MAGFPEIGYGGAHPNAIGVVHGNGAHTTGFRMVHVRVVGMAGVTAGVPEGDLSGQPVFLPVATHRDGAGVAVEVVGDVHVGFHLAEIRQAIGELPLVVAQGGPGVVVFRHAAQQHLAVDGGGTAHHLAARHRHGIGLAGVLRPEGPVMRRVHRRRRLVVPVF